MAYRLKPLLLLALLAVSAGCSTTKGKAGMVCPAPEIVTVAVPYYVPVDDELTTPLPIAKGTLAEMPAVARKRKEALETCNIDRASVRKLQGSPVPDKAKP